MINLLKPKVIGATAVGATAGFATQHVLTKALLMPKDTLTIANYEVPVEGLFSKYQTNIADTLEKTINAILKNPRLYPRLQKTVMKPEFKDALFGFIIKFVYETCDKKTINEFISFFLNDEKKELLINNLKDFIAKLLVEKTDKEVLGTLLANEGIKIFRDVLSGTVLQRFLNERLFTSIANGISIAVHKVVETSATQKILDITFKEVDSVMDQTVPALLKMVSIDEEAMRKMLEAVYDTIFLEVIPDLLENVDFGDLVKTQVLKVDVEKVYNFINSKCSKAVLAVDGIAGLVTGALSGFTALCVVK